MLDPVPGTDNSSGLDYLHLENPARFARGVVQFKLVAAWNYYSTNPCRVPPCKSHFPLSLSA
jgi:hypothetical protein